MTQTAPTPDYHRGRAEALLQVATHLRRYAEAAKPAPSWWPCEKYKAAGRVAVLEQLQAFATQLEAEGKRLPAAAERKCGWCEAGRRTLARMRRWLP